jgi:CBS domain containing-hemolysin-like protein
VLNIIIPLLAIRMLSTGFAILVSATVIFVFIEIIPRTIFIGPNQLRISATLAPITIAIVIIQLPIAIPLSMSLQYFLGEPKKVQYSNDDLKDLIGLLFLPSKSSEESQSAKMRSIEVSKKLIESALNMRELKASDVMQDYEYAIAIDINQRITESFIKKLREDGYSRYPVYKYNKHYVVGILLVKKLIGLDRFNIALSDIKSKLRSPLVVSPSKPLTELFVEFRKGNSHIALVTDQIEEVKRHLITEKEESKGKADSIDELLLYSSTATIKGIVTLEDVMEVVLGV